MKVIAFKVEEDLLELLDRYAMRYGLNRSEAIRKVIREATDDMLKRDTVPKAKVEKISLR